MRKKISRIITEEKIYEKYPNQLTIDQFDSINWDFQQEFRDENYDCINGKSSTENACNAVIKFVIKNNNQYVIYTLIDGQHNMIYSKGNHFCNRIGTWQVVKNMRYEK